MNETATLDSAFANVAEETHWLKELEEEISRSVLPIETDDETARLHHYVRAKAAIADERKRVEEMMRSILADLDRRDHGIDLIYGHFAEDYVRRYTAHGKARSIKTPWGTAGFRKQPERLAVIDKDVVRQFVEEGRLPAECLKIRYDASQTALAELWKQYGEIPPGCEVIPETDKFYVK